MAVLIERYLNVTPQEFDIRIRRLYHFCSIENSLLKIHYCVKNVPVEYIQCNNCLSNETENPINNKKL